MLVTVTLLLSIALAYVGMREIGRVVTSDRLIDSLDPYTMIEPHDLYADASIRFEAWEQTQAQNITAEVWDEYAFADFAQVTHVDYGLIDVVPDNFDRRPTSLRVAAFDKAKEAYIYGDLLDTFVGDRSGWNWGY